MELIRRIKEIIFDEVNKYFYLVNQAIYDSLLKSKEKKIQQFFSAHIEKIINTLLLKGVPESIIVAGCILFFSFLKTSNFWSSDPVKIFDFYIICVVLLVKIYNDASVIMQNDVLFLLSSQEERILYYEEKENYILSTLSYRITISENMYKIFINNIFKKSKKPLIITREVDMSFNSNNNEKNPYQSSYNICSTKNKSFFDPKIKFSDVQNYFDFMQKKDPLFSKKFDINRCYYMFNLFMEIHRTNSLVNPLKKTICNN